MDTRIELTDGSISTRSCSLRDTVSGFSSSSGERAASISGTLWRSAVCDAKSHSEIAAISDDRTHFRYGLSDCDCSFVSLEGWVGGEVRVCGKREIPFFMPSSLPIVDVCAAMEVGQRGYGAARRVQAHKPDSSRHPLIVSILYFLWKHYALPVGWRQHYCG